MAMKRNMHGGPQSVGNGVTPGSFAPRILGAPTKCPDSVETVDWRTELDELTSPLGPGMASSFADQLERAEAGGFLDLELGLTRIQLSTSTRR